MQGVRARDDRVSGLEIWFGRESAGAGLVGSMFAVQGYLGHGLLFGLFTG